MPWMENKSQNDILTYLAQAFAVRYKSGKKSSLNIHLICF